MRALSSGPLARFILVPALFLAAASARGDDLAGVVKSVDPDAKTLVVVQDGSGREVEVTANDRTAIQAGGDKSVDLARLQPGVRVVVRDVVVAAEIAVAGEVLGTVRSVDPSTGAITLTEDGSGRVVALPATPRTVFLGPGRGPIGPPDLRVGSRVVVLHDGRAATKVVVERGPTHAAGKFLDNLRHNLFKPLLLFFYIGFLIPVLGVKFEFPYVIYQALTIYLLIAIGWHGGEELAQLSPSSLGQAAGFMGVGFATNLFIGLIAYGLLRASTRLRRVDAATVAGYYGSDSAGTFVTCLGVLVASKISYAAYMPVMLAVMEIPGCLVALALVAMLRRKGMDARGNSPGEPGYDPAAAPAAGAPAPEHDRQATEDEADLALERTEHSEPRPVPAPAGLLSPQLLHEVFLNPGIYLLFAGILIGFVSRLQGPDVTRADDSFFVDLFQGVLCLFLLEMGMTAARKLRDLRAAGLPFIAFGMLAPNLFATLGILVAHGYSHLIGQPLALGTYVLFAVLCGAASYIAVPAVQRLAIPEASPTLPLAASLGLTFSYNVTIGIPVYIEIAEHLIAAFPVR